MFADRSSPRLDAAEVERVVDKVGRMFEEAIDELEALVITPYALAVPRRHGDHQVTVRPCAANARARLDGRHRAPMEQNPMVVYLCPKDVNFSCEITLHETRVQSSMATKIGSRCHAYTCQNSSTIAPSLLRARANGSQPVTRQAAATHRSPRASSSKPSPSTSTLRS
jgi:hypothetical protein